MYMLGLQSLVEFLTSLLVTRMTTSLSKLRDEGRNGDRGTLHVQGVESISDLTSNYRKNCNFHESTCNKATNKTNNSICSTYI